MVARAITASAELSPASARVELCCPMLNLGAPTVCQRRQADAIPEDFCVVISGAPATSWMCGPLSRRAGLPEAGFAVDEWAGVHVERHAERAAAQLLAGNADQG